MKNILFKKWDTFKTMLEKWTTKNYLSVSILNIVIIILFMLRSAGYFYPYFLISVNFIVVVGLIMSVFLFNAGSRVMFVVSLFFWLFAGVMRLFYLDTWAERTAVYTVEALLIGIILLIYEDIKSSNKQVKLSKS